MGRMGKPIDYYVDEKGCFICTSHHLDKDGYAMLKYKGRPLGVHRFIYREMFGEIPKGYFVRHKCDNPTCINPEHLEVGTPQDNVNDMVERNRQRKGVHIYCAKLNENQVRAIKYLLKIGESPTDISRDLGVNRKRIYDIVHKDNWKHIKVWGE